jgi:hypothetical protein
MGQAPSVRRGRVLLEEDVEHAVGQCAHPQRQPEGHEGGEAEVQRLLIGQHPEGSVAERQAPDSREGEEDELGAGQSRVNATVHEAGDDDGDDAERAEQGKVAHR